MQRGDNNVPLKVLNIYGEDRYYKDKLVKLLLNILPDLFYVPPILITNTKYDSSIPPYRLINSLYVTPKTFSYYEKTMLNTGLYGGDGSFKFGSLLDYRKNMICILNIEKNHTITDMLRIEPFDLNIVDNEDFIKDNTFMYILKHDILDDNKVVIKILKEMKNRKFIE